MLRDASQRERIEKLESDEWRCAAPQHEGRERSNHLLRLVVGLAVTAQCSGAGAGVELLQTGGDLGVLALEQAVTGKIALDQKRPEALHFEHPDGLRQSKLLEPINAADPLDAAAEQCASPVSNGGEINGAVRDEVAAIDLGRHAGFADDDVAAGELEPAVEPFGESKGCRRRDRADGVAAVRIDGSSRGSMKIYAADRILAGRHPRAVLDGALVHAFAGGEDAASEIDHGADLQSAQVVGARRKIKADRLELGHWSIPPPARPAPPIQPWSGACSP